MGSFDFRSFSFCENKSEGNHRTPTTSWLTCFVWICFYGLVWFLVFIFCENKSESNQQTSTTSWLTCFVWTCFYGIVRFSVFNFGENKCKSNHQTLLTAFLCYSMTNFFQVINKSSKQIKEKNKYPVLLHQCNFSEFHLKISKKKNIYKSWKLSIPGKCQVYRSIDKNTQGIEFK